MACLSNFRCGRVHASEHIAGPGAVSPADLFDLIIFDEAHHAPADTWSAYLGHYSRAKFVFLTATPFRRDKKAILGRLAYSYPVSKASREQAFGSVSFRPAPVHNDHDEDEVDLAIARAAIAQLREDQAQVSTIDCLREHPRYPLLGS